MITSGYAISNDEAIQLKALKNSDLYSIYIKSIGTSPAYKVIIGEHIENIDITPDIDQLKSDNKLPATVNSKALSDLFKDSMSKVMIPLVADAIILKELENIKIDEIINDLKNDTDIIYLLGLAEPTYYAEANKLVQTGKIGPNDIAFKGLVSYMKRNTALTNQGKRIEPKINIEKKKKSTKVEKTIEEKKIDVSSNDINL